MLGGIDETHGLPRRRDINGRFVSARREWRRGRRMPLIMRHDAALKLLSFAMACFTIFLSLVESLKVRGKLECLPTFIRDAVHVRQPTNTHPCCRGGWHGTFCYVHCGSKPTLDAPDMDPRCYCYSSVGCRLRYPLLGPRPL